MPVNKSERKKRYDRLIEAGFNSREANKYKDRSEFVIDELIAEKMASNERLKELEGRRHSHVKKG